MNCLQISVSTHLQDDIIAHKNNFNSILRNKKVERINANINANTKYAFLRKNPKNSEIKKMMSFVFQIWSKTCLYKESNGHDFIPKEIRNGFKMNNHVKSK